MPAAQMPATNDFAANSVLNVSNPVSQPMVDGGNSQAFQQGAPGQQPAKMHFHIQTPDGDQIVDDQWVMNMLGQAGHPVMGITPDGLNAQFANMPQPIPIQQLFQQAGIQVTKSEPANMDMTRIDPYARMAVSMIGSPDEQKAFLESRVRRETGDMKPQIMGSGRDFYQFDPQSGQYYALTNKPDKWDWSDVMEALPIAARSTAAVAGGIAGNAPGAVLAGAGADAAMRGAMFGLDDDFRQSVSLKDQAMQTGMNSAIDVGTLGLVKGAGAASGLRQMIKGGAPEAIPAAQQAMESTLRTGPIASMAKGIGFGGRAVSSGAEMLAGKAADSPMAVQTISMMNPITGPAANAGFMAQLPKMALTGPLQGAGKAAESNIVREALGEETSGAIRTGVQDIMRSRAPAGRPFLNWSRAGRGLSEEGRGPQAADIIQNMAEKGRMRFTPNAEQAGNAARNQFNQGLESMGIDAIDPAFNQTLAEETGRIAQNAQSASNAQVGKQFGQKMRPVGKAIDIASDIGRSLEGGANAATYGTLRGIQGLGKAGKAGFGALQQAGEFMQPVEPHMWSQFLGRKYVTKPMSEESSLRDLRRRLNRDTLQTTLAER